MDGVFDGDVLPGQQQLMPHQEEGVRRIMHAWLEDSVWDGKDAMFPLRSFLLFDEPGLGKTRQALTAIARLHERGIVGPYLVCAVKAVIPQWIDEANRHFAGTFTVRDFSKPTFQLTPNTLAVVSYGTLTSWFKYELSRPLDDAEHRARVYRGLDMPIGDATTDEEEKHLAHVQFTILQTMLRGKPRLPSKSMQKAVTCLYDTNWTAVVFDEVHVLSNTGTSQTRASRYLSATYRLGLSGTPLRNSGFDMISLLKYPLDIRKARFKLISDNPSGSYATTLLERATFGRLKKDVPEVAAVLAERDESSENLLVSWQDDPHARQQYLGIRNASKVTLDELAAMRKMPTETNFEFNLRRKRTVTDVWAVVRRMQQTCLHRCIPDMALKLETASGWPDWRPDTHAKFPTWFRAKVFTTLLCLKRAAPQGTLDHNMRRLICAYMAIGEEHAVQPSPKMLKFMQIYHHMLREGRNKIIAASESRVFLERILMPYLQTNGIGCVLYGGGSSTAKASALATFENESSCHVLCLVKQAGAYGLNLQHCNYLVQFDPHWNAARDEQAVQRIHRIGQHHEVRIFKLWMAGSIDIAIRTMQNSKLKAIASWTRKTAGDEARNLDICCLHLREQDRVHDDTIALAPHPFVAPSLLAVRPPVVQWPAPMPLPFTNPYLEQKDQNAWLGCAVDTDECLYTMLQEARNMPNLSGWTKPAFGFEVPVEFDVPSFRPGTSKACPHLVVTMEAHHSNYTWDLVVLPGTVTYDPSYQVNVHYDQHKRVYASCYCWSGCTIDGQPVSRCTAIRLLPGQTLTFINAISRVSLTYHFSDGVVPPQLPLYAHQQRYTEPVYVQSLSLVKGTLVLYMGQLGVASSSRAVILEDGDGIVRSTERMDVHLAPPIGFIGEPICVACTPCIITSPGEATDKQGKKHLFLIHDRYRVGSMLSFEEYRRRGGIVQQPVPIFVGEVQEPVPKKIKA